MNSKYSYTNEMFQEWFDKQLVSHNMTREDVAKQLRITLGQLSNIYVGTYSLHRHHILSMIKIFRSKEIPEDLYQKFNI